MIKRTAKLFLLTGMLLCVASPVQAEVRTEEISFDASWMYGENAKIKNGKGILYTNDSGNGITVCINAGHGTEGGKEIFTLCHPDGSPKVTDGTTKKGETKSMAVAPGMKFKDGTKEPVATLSLAKLVKDDLLEEGYNVLMVRDSDNVELDNIARTVMANNTADCHISLHYDSTDSDKGVFFASVPSVKSYREMEPVKSYWKEHNRLGNTLVKALNKEGFSLYNGGSYDLDLTQTSYSTVPSVDLEVGDAASDYGEETQKKLSKGIVKGIQNFFKGKKKKSSENKK